ncbi:jg3148, partial [Pararge aegeria aegeria]
STMSFDRIPDMYVRVSQPITHPAAFELICTRIFLEAWQGDSRLIRYEDFSFDHEILPGVEPYCATPDCDCDQ